MTEAQSLEQRASAAIRATHVDLVEHQAQDVSGDVHDEHDVRREHDDEHW